MTDQPVPTALYRVYGDGDLLLYIGISNNFGHRWQQHASVQPWWGEKRRLTVEWLASRPEAEEAEPAAIKAEKPKYNITYAEPRPPRAKRKAVADPAPPGADVQRKARRPLLDVLFPLNPIPGVPTLGEIAFPTPARIDEFVSKVPGEKREEARVLLETSLKGTRIMRRLGPVMAELRELELSGDPRIAPAARNARQRLARTLFGPCTVCKGEPPRGMTCQECGVEGAGLATITRRKEHAA
jgi:predicted GIY-YIG superfamily endonuclease